MRKPTFVFLSWLMLSAVTLQPQAVFADDTIANNRADVANGQTIYNEGNGDTAGCGDCHGKKGLGIDAKEAPRLANLGQIYAIKQLDDYALGKRIAPGVGAVMNDIARMLSDQDRLDVSAYLDSLEYEAEPSNLKALAADGIRIGDPKNGKIIMARGIKPLVPACKDCHGMSGRSQNIGAIHQQKYVYLVNQLKRYREGHRVNDQEVNKVGIMRGIAKHLTDENIADIAAYLSTVSNSAP
ncbi:MAG: c-type cytochrome [Nitrosomonadales bacterium]|nr:c-type cytochrome [Nitrosomonadales bacterium]